MLACHTAWLWRRWRGSSSATSPVTSSARAAVGSFPAATGALIGRAVYQARGQSQPGPGRTLGPRRPAWGGRAGSVLDGNRGLAGTERGAGALRQAQLGDAEGIHEVGGDRRQHDHVAAHLVHIVREALGLAVERH